MTKLKNHLTEKVDKNIFFLKKIVKMVSRKIDQNIFKNFVKMISWKRYLKEAFIKLVGMLERHHCTQFYDLGDSPGPKKKP